MPKTESDYTEEIKIRASKEFVDMYDRYSSRDQYRGLILGHKNLSEFIRATILYWFELHAPNLIDKNIPEVAQYIKNKKKAKELRKIIREHISDDLYQGLLSEFGAKEALVSYYMDEDK